MCEGRIDLYNWDLKISNEYNFCCAISPGHYRSFIDHWGSIPNIEHDTIDLYDGNRLYHIEQYYNGDCKTTVSVLNLDPEGRVYHNEGTSAKSSFVFSKLFDYSQTTREKILNRVKMILVFQ